MKNNKKLFVLSIYIMDLRLILNFGFFHYFGMFVSLLIAYLYCSYEIFFKVLYLYLFSTLVAYLIVPIFSLLCRYYFDKHDVINVAKSTSIFCIEYNIYFIIIISLLYTNNFFDESYFIVLNNFSAPITGLFYFFIIGIENLNILKKDIK